MTVRCRGGEGERERGCEQERRWDKEVEVKEVGKAESVEVEVKEVGKAEGVEVEVEEAMMSW